MPLIPWAILQLDTIKAVIHDLGLAHLTSRTARKNDLVKLLYSIDLEGREYAHNLAHTCS